MRFCVTLRSLDFRYCEELLKEFKQKMTWPNVLVFKGHSGCRSWRASRVLGGQRGGGRNPWAITTAVGFFLQSLWALWPRTGTGIAPFSMT